MIWRNGILLLILTQRISAFHFVAPNDTYIAIHKETDLFLLYSECDEEGGVWCDDGVCATKEQTCDGKFDCADGSDENIFCSTEALEGTCNVKKGFFCRGDQKCIPREKVCDEENDCESGVDEKFCTDWNDAATDSKCKGFVCKNGQCISKLWTCDGHYDCVDQSDEDVNVTCQHSHLSHTINDGLYCVESPQFNNRTYKCIDASFCLPGRFMCDGLDDCKDGSDEGPFCQRWHKMCENMTCLDGAKCSSERYGPTCICPDQYAEYNETTQKCVVVNKCQLNRPQCSQICNDEDGKVKCSCEKGYIEDEDLRRCFAPEPSALLFFNTKREMGYMEMKSRKTVIFNNTESAQGQVYNGKYLYYVRSIPGKQAVMRAELDNFEASETILFTVGIERPHLLALDWLGGHLYFSDMEHGSIFACQLDVWRCAKLPAVTKFPLYVTLDVIDGNMYWSDFFYSKQIRTAKMDGTHTKVLVDNINNRLGLHGLALDTPNHRLYYITSHLYAINLKMKNPQPYVIYTDQQQEIWTAIPRGIAVFENSIYWTETGTTSIKITDKMSSVLSQRHHGVRHTFLSLHKIPREISIYHPILTPNIPSPCESHNCSHFCFIMSSTTFSCGCPDGMNITEGNTCVEIPGYYPEYMIIGFRNTLTRVQYNSIGSLDSEATLFDIGDVRALAYDNIKDRLFIYDGQRKIISYTNMSDFTLGAVHILIDSMLENVTDIDYDYIADNLYFLNAGHHTVEVYSLKTKKRAILRTFDQREKLISFCVMPIHGKMLIAIDNGDIGEITIDSITLDGTQRYTIVENNLKGPRIALKYYQPQDLVYVSDEGDGYIDFMSPEGKGRETYRKLNAPITGLAVTSTYVFYTFRSTSALYWTMLSETSKVKRFAELTMFPNITRLHMVATNAPPEPNDPLLSHPCRNYHTCSDICIQTPQLTDLLASYKCLCSTGLIEVDNKCEPKVKCDIGELYCFKSEKCILKTKICDGVKDCSHGEDEMGCNAIPVENNCFQNEKLCNGACISSDETCLTPHTEPACDNTTHHVCAGGLCLERALVCDGTVNCPDGSDEGALLCLTPCANFEFSCGRGQCIRSTWQCDGEEDCSDGSDEFGCPNAECGSGKFRCDNTECIKMSMRCDGNIDCDDLSDEKDCQEVIPEFKNKNECEEWEYTCEQNRSICLPYTAKLDLVTLGYGSNCMIYVIVGGGRFKCVCNSVEDCPGGTDEKDCEDPCTPTGLFSCKNEKLCLHFNKVCDGKADCLEGNDEIEENCQKMNRQPHKFSPVYSPSQCHNGFRCNSGECIEWDEVCDTEKQCFDGSDEQKDCDKPCTPDLGCPHTCHRTPAGPRCSCPPGMKYSNHHCRPLACIDDVCSQMCQNTRHMYVCQCYEGYSLRSDKRTCKVNNGSMEIIYVTAGRSAVQLNRHRSSRHDKLLFNDKQVVISDIGVQARTNMLYIATEGGELIIVNGTDRIGSITNIGRPTRLAVEWITGNVYFADNTPDKCYMRVCNFEKNKCAKLQRLPHGGDVLSMAIDIRSTLIFYCVANGQHHTIFSSTLSGQNVRELALVNNCTGLAVESYKKVIYVSESDPDHIMVVDYNGVKQRKLVSNNPHVRSPQNLEIFEDHVYFLQENTKDMARCLLFGPRSCETFLTNVFDTNLFVIKHEATQRKVNDFCQTKYCSNLCVLDHDLGSNCICKDGSVAGTCADKSDEKMPIIQDLRSKSHVLVVVAWVVGVVIVSMLTIYVIVNRTSDTASRSETYASFRANTTPGSSRNVEEVTIHVADPEGRPEYQNPLAFVPNFFRRTFRRSGRPFFGANTPTQSDTTSGVSSPPTASKSQPDLPSDEIGSEHLAPLQPSSSTDTGSEEGELKGAKDPFRSPKKEDKAKEQRTAGSLESLEGLLEPKK